jgi:hypothetical protein
MSWHVTLDFMTDTDLDDLDRWIKDLKQNRMLNTNDNEEGQMIDIDHLKVVTEIRE